MTFKKSVLHCTSIALLTGLLCGLVFSCPVFAVGSLEPLPFYADAGDQTRPFIFDNGFNFISTYRGITNVEDFYLFYVNQNDTLYTYGASPNELNVNGTYGVVYFAKQRNSGSVFSYSFLGPSFDTDTQLYFKNLGDPWSADTSTNVPVYSSVSDALSAVRNIIGGASSGDLITASSYFGVPAGYAAYIELPSSSTDWDITVTQEFDDYSSLFGGQWSPMTSLWGFQSSLPSGSGNFSKSGLNVIPMYKMKPYTVLGQSKTGFSNKSTMVANGFWSDTPSAKYLVIYNPVIRSVSGTVGGASIADNVYVYNKGISVTMNGYYSPVKYYKLESSVTTSGLESAPAYGTFEDSEYTETFDSEGNSQGIVNSSGDSSTLEDGGGDLIPSATSIGDYVRNFNQTLNNFASNFIDLMTSPISHVQQLINAGSNYFNVIQGLYGWLPDEVHAVVKSGMVVALSIGVISVLL